ncbi:MAG: hypothetical protein E7612_01680 [Ruminococcaceae bacterium]|nr:hypothetical protein [Oscillospiraceae bacterium]
MRLTLEKLWNEYFAEECAAVNTNEERVLAKKVVEMHKLANELLTNEQRQAVERYVEAQYEIQGSFGKKAFLSVVNL